MDYFTLLLQNSTDNKYYRWYVNICQRAQSQTRQKGQGTYYEKHHILPKSFMLGGYKDARNLVHLTAREHYIVHILLPKFAIGDYRKKMIYALWYLSNRNIEYVPSSRLYESAKRKYIDNVKNRIDSEETKKKKSRPGKLNGMWNKTHTDNVKQQQSMRMTGRLLGKSYEEQFGKDRAAYLKQDKSTKLKEFIKSNPGVRAGRNNANSKQYEITSPAGKIYVIKGTLKEFCKEHQIYIGGLIDVAKNRKTEYKGWTAKYI